MARLATGLETMSYKELTEQINLDVKELGAFLLGKRRFRGGLKDLGCGIEVLDLLYEATVSVNYRKRDVGLDKAAAFES